MFKKLRNRFILTNLGVTLLVILVAFTGIYISSISAADRRPPIKPEQEMHFSADMEDIITENIEQEKQAAAKDLLVTLIVSGVVIEIAVTLVSYFMAEEAIRPVREAYTAQKVFIANASHEIKTPLAAISANLEAADIKGNRWIDNIEAETAKLTALNNQLLTLARTDLVTKNTLTEANLANIINSAVQSFEPRLAGKDFSQKIGGDEKIKVNVEDLTQILSILLDNAIKYSDKKIILEASPHKIVVKNDGAKIKDEDLPHVFERFYQTDKTREGVGLGLSIAQSLADRNHWKISVSSDKMTSFTLVF